MPNPPPSPVPAAEPAATVRRLRRLLDEAGFAAGPIRSALESGGERLVRRSLLPVHRRRLAGRETALAALVRLFVLGDPIEADAAERVLGDGLGVLAELRLVREEAGSLAATARLVPHEDLLIASDRPDAAAGPEQVAGVHRPSTALGHLTVRRGGERALDVGTGNGIQALLLARHAASVVATDVNERALGFATFNAALNACENVDLRRGSFFEPVAEERFDLVVSNPPFVVSPDADRLFRDGGLPADAVSETVVRALPERLADGAFGTVLASWALRDGDEDPTARPRSWLAGGGCETWLLHTSSDDPLTTAGVWNQEAAGDADAYGTAIDRWLDYFRLEGIEAIVYGVLVVRRRAGRPGWFRAARLPFRRARHAGEQLRRMFDAQDEPAVADDEALLGGRFELVPEARLEQTVRREGGSWRIAEATLVLAGGLGFRAELDRELTRVVLGLDGARPLGEVVAEAAARSADGERTAEAGAALVRRLLELGVAVRVRDS